MTAGAEVRLVVCVLNEYLKRRSWHGTLAHGPPALAFLSVQTSLFACPEH